MKRWLIPLLVIMVLAFASTVSAKPHDRHDRHGHGNGHKWSHSAYHENKHWHRVAHYSSPFRWHEHRDYFQHRGHRLERLSDYEWHERFPGLHAYRWHDDGGFWYQGHHKSDAVMFYDDGDTLVGIGFMHNGAFIMMRDDDTSHENRESFFLSWNR